MILLTIIVDELILITKFLLYLFLKMRLKYWISGVQMIFKIFWIYHLFFLLSVFFISNVYIFMDTKKNFKELPTFRICQRNQIQPISNLELLWMSTKIIMICNFYQFSFVIWKKSEVKLEKLFGVPKFYVVKWRQVLKLHPLAALCCF